jgi:uncharacterized protein (DUF1697 family)
LFEQASQFRGHAQESANGILTFRLLLETNLLQVYHLQAAYEMRKELLEYQRDFYVNAKNESKKSKTKAYIFGDEKMQQG